METAIFPCMLTFILVCQRSYGQEGKEYIITDLPNRGKPPSNYPDDHSTLQSNLKDQETKVMNFTYSNDQEMKFMNAYDNQQLRNTNFSEQETMSMNTSGKHPSLTECIAIILEEGDYILFENGTVYVETYNQSLNSSLYHLFANGNLLICSTPDKFEQDNAYDRELNIRRHLVFYYLTRFCLSISILCLMTHLIVFYILPELRNLPGCCIASLCLSLLLFYLLFIISDNEKIQESKVLCKFISTTSYFFILSAFTWMGTMSYDVFRSLLRATGKLRLSSKRFAAKRYVYYGLFSWGFPLTFAVIASVMDNVEGLIPYDYRPQFAEVGCWFGSRTALLILFGGPVFVIIGINILFFISSAYIIYVSRLKTEQTAYMAVVKKNFTLHYRLGTIMGLTWILGVANSSRSFWLLSLYVLFSSLQGFFIFLACTCTIKVRRRLKGMLNLHDRKISTISTAATFQSYVK